MADKQQNSGDGQATKVSVRPLKYAYKPIVPGFVGIFQGPTDDDLMGKEIRELTLVLPPTEKGAEATRIEFWKDSKEVKQDGKLLLPPHYNEWLRLLVAHAVAGWTMKGSGYALSVAMNTESFKEDIKKLVDRGAVVEARYAKQEKWIYAPFKSLYEYAVLHASLLKTTAERWPAETKVAEEIISGEPERVEVEFSL